MKSKTALKRVYWTTTILFCAMMGFSALGYLTQEQMRAAFVHLGFPSYFRIELAIAKFLGVTALLAPVPVLAKHWAYAGFGITIVSAVTAHTSSGDPFSVIAAPIFAGLLYSVSYMSFLRLSK